MQNLKKNRAPSPFEEALHYNQRMNQIKIMTAPKVQTRVVRASGGGMTTSMMQ